MLPALDLPLVTIGAALDEAAMALGDVKLARSQKDWALLESSTRRLAGLGDHLFKTVNANRPRS
jgi:hypothetical protein